MAIQTNAKPNKEPVMIAVPFYPDELETIAQDVEALLHKKILRVPSHTDPNMKAQIFIRFAVLDYTHKAIQKQLDNDTDKVHQAKRVVNEMEAMMKSMRTREKALVDKETELVHSQEVAQEIVAKYMKLLKDRGFLNEGTS